MFKKALVSVSTLCIAMTLSLSSYSDTLKVILYDGGSPPLFFAKSENKTGIYVDILMAIGDKTGHKFEFNHLPTKRAMALFENGKMHLEPGINPIWRSSSKVPGEFSEPFGKAEDIVIFPKGKLKPVNGPEDLSKSNIGTIKGFFYPGYMDAFGSRKITRKDSLDEDKLMLKLANNRIDAAFIRKEAAQYRIKTDSKLANIETGNVIGSADIMFRIHPSKSGVIPSINKAISELQASGALDAIYNKYR
jgi:polar amino acid transport system substrate-binding protein